MRIKFLVIHYKYYIEKEAKANRIDQNMKLMLNTYIIMR